MIEFFQKPDFLVRAAGGLVKSFYNYVFSLIDGIGSCLAFGLPVLSFPDRNHIGNHIEQENNATVLEEEGYGKRMSYNEPPENILASILKILNEGQYYDKKTGELGKFAEELDGPACVRKLLENMIKDNY